MDLVALRPIVRALKSIYGRKGSLNWARSTKKLKYTKIIFSLSLVYFLYTFKIMCIIYTIKKITKYFVNILILLSPNVTFHFINMLQIKNYGANVAIRSCIEPSTLIEILYSLVKKYICLALQVEDAFKCVSLKIGTAIGLPTSFWKALIDLFTSYYSHNLCSTVSVHYRYTICSYSLVRDCDYLIIISRYINYFLLKKITT